MIGRSTLVWLGLIAAATGILFHTSYRVQELEATLDTLNRAIVAEQDAIHVLKAEWSYLNEPERLESLAQAHLPLQPTTPVQINSIAALPDRQPTGIEMVKLMPLPGRKPSPPVAGLYLADLGTVGMHGSTR